MNRNLKVATFAVLLAAALAFGVVATTGIVAPVHAQAPAGPAPGGAAGGNMSGGNATGGAGGNMTK